MSWTFSISGAAIVKAGVGASSTITMNSTALNQWSDDAEDEICVAARYDLIANYGSLTTNGKKILGALASSKIAQNILTYDAEGYIRSREQETILDKLENDIKRLTKYLEDDKFKKYLNFSSS